MEEYHFYYRGFLFIKGAKPDLGTVNIFQFMHRGKGLGVYVSLEEIDCFNQYGIDSYEEFQTACMEHEDNMGNDM